MPMIHRCYRVQSKDDQPYVYDTHLSANQSDITNYISRGPVTVTAADTGEVFNITEGDPVNYAVDGVKSNVDPTKFFFVKSLYHSQIAYTRRYPYAYSGIAVLGGRNTEGSSNIFIREFDKFHYDDMTTSTYTNLTSDTNASSSCTTRNDVQIFGGTTGGSRRNIYRTDGFGEIELPNLGFPSGSPRSGAATNGTDIVLTSLTYYNSSGAGVYDRTTDTCKYRWDDRSVEVKGTNSMNLPVERHGSCGNEREWLRAGGRDFSGGSGTTTDTIEKGRYTDDVGVQMMMNSLQQNIDNCTLTSTLDEVRAISSYRFSKFRYDDSVTATSMSNRTVIRSTGHVVGIDGVDSYYLATGWVSGGTNTNQIQKMRFADDAACQVISPMATTAKQSCSGGSIE
jgi:hypothetical protein